MSKPFDRVRSMKNVWWVAVFFLILAAFLFPTILLSDIFSFEVTLVHQVIMLMVVSAICQKLRQKPLSELIGRINFNWLKDLSVGLLIGAILMLLPALLLTIFGYIQWSVTSFTYASIASGLWIFLLVAIAEELLFRGFIFQRLIQSVGEWPAQLIIAGLFLLTHLNNEGMTGSVAILASINIFIASILFGFAYLKTKSLAMPLGLHFMANVMQGTILGFGVSGEKDSSLFQPAFDEIPVWLNGGDFGLEASGLGLGVLVLITAYIYVTYPIKIDADAH